MPTDLPPIEGADHLQRSENEEHDQEELAMAQTQRIPEAAAHRTADPVLCEGLEAWLDAGLLSAEQAEAILAFEKARAGPPPSAPAGSARRRVPVVAEALGYLGGAFVLAGVVLLLAQYWAELASPIRIGLAAVGAVSLLVGGSAIREGVDPPLTRLRWFLWSASAAATGVLAALVAVDGFGVHQTRTIVLVAAAALATHGGLLWRGRFRPLQQAGFLTGAVVTNGAVGAHLGSSGMIGALVWFAGLVLVVTGLRGTVPVPALTELAGAVALLLGAMITIEANQGRGMVFALATAAALLGLASSRVDGVDRVDRLVLGAPALLAVLQLLPSSLSYFSRDGAVVTGLTTWAVGILLLAAGSRRWLRPALVIEIAGGTGAVGGAALIGVESPGSPPSSASSTPSPWSASACSRVRRCGHCSGRSACWSTSPGPSPGTSRVKIAPRC